jgi:hypothetical protein
MAYPFGGMAGQAARATDPYARHIESLTDAWRAKTPVVREGLEPKIDVFGERVLNRDMIGPDMLSIIPQKQINDDPVLRAFQRLRFFPDQVGKEIMTVKLTPQEHTEYAIAAGKLAKMQLDMIVGMRDFQSIPPGVQLDMLEKTVKGARRAAASMVIMNHPHIMMDAVRAQQLHIETGASGAKLRNMAAPQ